MPKLVKCSNCKAWQEQTNPTASMFACLKCGQTIIAALLMAGDSKTGDFIICGCRKSTFERRPGVSEYSCVHCGVVRIDAATSQQLATLDKFGTLIMEFKQQELIPAMLGAPLVAKVGVEGGACHGICLQWIRRQLLSKKTSDRHRYSEGDKTKKAVLKGVQTHIVRKQADTWDQFVAGVDAKRNPASAQRFANIERFAVGSQTRVQMKAYAEGVCTMAAFEVGRGALVGCRQSPAVPGHTVALWKKPDSYFLFDPNNGVYDVKTTDNLSSALKWLFCDDTTGLKAADGSCEGNYELFRRRA